MKVIMTGGGTGGHIYPAIAIADKIRREHPEAEILFVGTQRGMEKDLVPKNGYPIKFITVSGFHRKQIWKNVGTARDLMKGLKEAKKIRESKRAFTEEEKLKLRNFMMSLSPKNVRFYLVNR